MVIAVLLSIGLMIVDHRYHHLEYVRSILSVITYPLQRLADSPIQGKDWLADTLTSRSSLQEENQRLHRENLELRALLQKHESLEAENLRLRDLLDSSLKLGDRVLIAELSAVDLDPYKQQVIINKGSRSGLYKGQPVLDANGVMGQLLHVNPFSSTALLVSDASHALPVQVLRNGLRTIAVGTGRIDQLDLPYLPNNADIEAGDLIVTSGLGGKFPPGYPVAAITRVNRPPDKPFAEITATPRAHLDRSREVLLVWSVSPIETSAADETAETSGASSTDPETEKGVEQ